LLGFAARAMKNIQPTAQLKTHAQSGFTLLELLIALAITAVLLFVIPRFIAGLVVDNEGISAHQDQTAQTHIALSNLRRDVAQAGFVPLAYNFEAHKTVGLTIDNNSITVAAYQPKSAAKDCNGASKFGSDEQRDGWVYVKNTYALVRDSKSATQGTLKCDGNGGANGRQPILDHLVDMQVTSVNNPASDNNAAARIISVCLVSTEDNKNLGGAPTTTMCDNATQTPKQGHAIFYKVRADMAVLAAPMTAGQ
jgi:prepilin-type N-terminal cleavage/methylation domain-containing protein